MGVYDEDIQAARELIGEFGENAVITNLVTPVNPDDPSEPLPATETSYNVRAVFVNYTSREASQSYVDGTEIHLTDKKVLVAGVSLPDPPNLQGRITRQTGETLKIIKVRQLDPGAQRILYEIQARR